MHTVELYDSVKKLAKSMGYQIREENLGGVGGGACEVAGRKCLFVDITMSSAEQLDEVVSAMQDDPAIHLQAMDYELQSLFQPRRAA